MTLLPNAELLNQALNSANSDFKTSKPAYSSEGEKENLQGNSNKREIGIQAELCDCCLKKSAFKSPKTAAKEESGVILQPLKEEENVQKDF